MIEKLFNIFLKLDFKVAKFDVEIDNEDTKVGPYYKSFFNKELECTIYEDVSTKEKKIFEEQFKRINGVSSQEYVEYLHNNPDNKSKKEIERFVEKNKDIYDEIWKTSRIEFLKYCKNTYDLEEEDMAKWVFLGIDTEDFAEMIGIKLYESDMYDAYGSGLYKVEDRDFVIFGSYDNGSNRANAKIVVSLCCYDPNTYEFELADILYDEDNDKFYLSEIQRALMPETLREFHVREICGKRNWNWNVKEKTVGFRSSVWLREKVGKAHNIKNFIVQIDLE